MPTVSITLDIDEAAQARLDAILADRGFTGTSQERLAEVRRLVIVLVKNWIKRAEAKIADQATTDPGVG